METVEVDVEQLLLIVQANTFIPKPKLVILVFADVGDVIVPLPETTVQEPVPIAALLAVIKAELFTQIVWFTPALAVVGAGSTVIASVALGATQTPFVITHSKTLTPTPKLFKVVVADVGEVIVPLPETNDQEPVPTVGTFPEIVAVGLTTQIV